MAIANKSVINKMWDQDSAMVMPSQLKFNFNDIASKECTQVFVLSPEVALAAEKLLRSPTFKFTDISEWHIPYDHIAIEYPITEEIATNYRTTATGDNVEPIVIIGAYIEEFSNSSIGARGFKFTPYWQYKNGRIQFSLFSFILGGTDEALKAELDRMFPKVVLDAKHYSCKNVEAYVVPSMATLCAMYKAGLPPDALEKLVGNQAAITHMREGAVEIPSLLFACNMLINCKSGVKKTYVPERRPKISGLGKRLRNKLSASAYTVLHLSAIETVEEDGTIKSKLDTAAHYVRGHFKQRKHGVYWWSPFIRGTGEPRKREAYIVEQ